MWLIIGFVYFAGLAVTWATLVRSRIFQKDHLMNVGSILLWPFYWILYGVALLQNRSGR